MKNEKTNQNLIENLTAEVDNRKTQERLAEIYEAMPDNILKPWFFATMLLQGVNLKKGTQCQKH